MASGIVSEKGQVTIPSSIRRIAKIRPGTRVDFDYRDNEIVMRPMKSLLDLKGALKPYAIGKTNDLNEIREQALAEMAREKVDKMAEEDADAENR